MRTGIYFSKTKNLLTRDLTNHSAKVYILDETAVSYHIEFTDRLGIGTGEKSWVRKHHVKYISKKKRQVIPCKYVMDNVRIPYKD
jgi:hypothetical protein